MLLFLLNFLFCELFNLSNHFSAANTANPSSEWVFSGLYSLFVRLDSILKNNNKKPKHE